ncbi:MAG: hypothetical protein WCR31_11660 [Treponema sp.]
MALVKSIDVDFAGNKKEAKDHLFSIMQSESFCGKKVFNYIRIEMLFSSFRDDLSYIIEYPYTDAHYRDCYYCFYAAKFETLPRETIRVHVFSSYITSVESLLTADENSLYGKYYGFFIIRPLDRFPLGRSFLAPQVFSNCNFLCCLTCERVYPWSTTSGKRFSTCGSGYRNSYMCGKLFMESA